jgi:hypothetical protein
MKLQLKVIINLNKKVKTYPIRGYNLPNTMDLNLWGEKNNR